MFGQNTSGGTQGSSNQGSGTNTGSGQQGNPVGHGTSNGNGWSLKGRSLIGSLQKPSYDKNIEGKIVVEVWVDPKGNVIATEIGQGTTISDKSLQQSARQAAMNVKFTDGEVAKQQGFITYYYKLN